MHGVCCTFFVAFCRLQFSDHEMIRRASTEAMCNLLPHQKMFDHLKSADTLKLWAAFSQLGTEDPPTAAAALGCLAMAARDPEVISYCSISCCRIETLDLMAGRGPGVISVSRFLIFVPQREPLTTLLGRSSSLRTAMFVSPSHGTVLWCGVISTLCLACCRSVVHCLVDGF